MSSLTRTQIDQYWRDGFLFPLQLLSSAEALTARQQLEEMERDYPDRAALNRCLLLNAHYSFPFVHQLAVHPSIVAAVQSILGPNILAWGSELFAKEPGSTSYVGWHQDLFYWGMGSIDHEVTAWIALSEASPANGCMQYLPGSHLTDELVEPIETFAKDNALSRGQELPIDIDDNATVDVCMQPGQVALHHGRMYHASGANPSGQRRLGLTIRYVTPDVQPSVLGYDYATLVCGENSSDKFRILPPPRVDMGEAERERFELVAEHQSALYVRPEETRQPFWDRNA